MKEKTMAKLKPRPRKPGIQTSDGSSSSNGVKNSSEPFISLSINGWGPGRVRKGEGKRRFMAALTATACLIGLYLTFSHSKLYGEKDLWFHKVNGWSKFGFLVIHSIFMVLLCVSPPLRKTKLGHRVKVVLDLACIVLSCALTFEITRSRRNRTVDAGMDYFLVKCHEGFDFSRSNYELMNLTTCNSYQIPQQRIQYTPDESNMLDLWIVGFHLIFSVYSLCVSIVLGPGIDIIFTVLSIDLAFHYLTEIYQDDSRSKIAFCVLMVGMASFAYMVLSRRVGNDKLEDAKKESERELREVIVESGKKPVKVWK